MARREEPVTGEADLRLLKTEVPAVCLEGEVQWPSPAIMDPELWPTLRRPPEQQRDLITTSRNDGLLNGRRCGTLSSGKTLKTINNDGLLTGRRCGTLSLGKPLKTSVVVVVGEGERGGPRIRSSAILPTAPPSPAQEHLKSAPRYPARFDLGLGS